jgi:DNA-binding IclR family transcriptional regulator
MEDKPKYYLKTLGDAFAIMDVLSVNQAPMGVAELSKKLGIGKSKIHRLLDTLKYWGCVEQELGTRKYLLGFKVLELAMNKLKTIDLIKIASPFLTDMLRQCGETVHLAILDEGQVLYLDKKEAPQAVGIISKVGQRLPAHCTGLGKVLLAYTDEKTLGKIIKSIGLACFTKNTITEERILREELEKIRSRGFAFDNEEIEEGLCCVAAPINNYGGNVIAAISVSLPRFRFTPDKREFLVSKVIDTAQKISKNLGYDTTKREDGKGV